MGKQFDRVYRLLVGVEGSDGIVIEGKPKENALNITFDIDKDLTKQTNKCRLQVFNLSDKTAKIFERDDSICILEAGYSEDIGLRRIFVGAVLKAWTSLKGAWLLNWSYLMGKLQSVIVLCLYHMLQVFLGEKLLRMLLLQWD